MGSGFLQLFVHLCVGWFAPHKTHFTSFDLTFLGQSTVEWSFYIFFYSTFYTSSRKVAKPLCIVVELTFVVLGNLPYSYSFFVILMWF